MKKNLSIIVLIVLIAAPLVESKRNDLMFVGTWRTSGRKNGGVLIIYSNGLMKYIDDNSRHTTFSRYKRYGVWGIQTQTWGLENFPHKWYDIPNKSQSNGIVLNDSGRMYVSLSGNRLFMKTIDGDSNGELYYRAS